MKKTRFTEEQMVTILREADRRPVPEVAKRHGVSAQTIYSTRPSARSLQATKKAWRGLPTKSLVFAQPWCLTSARERAPWLKRCWPRRAFGSSDLGAALVSAGGRSRRHSPGRPTSRRSPRARRGAGHRAAPFNRVPHGPPF